MTEQADAPSRAEDMQFSWRSWLRIAWLTLRGLRRHGPAWDRDPSIKSLPAKPKPKDIDRAQCALFAHFLVYMIRHKGQLPDLPDDVADVAALSEGMQFQLQLGLLLEALDRSDGAAYNTALAAIRAGTWTSLVPAADTDGEHQGHSDDEPQAQPIERRL